MKSHAEVDSSRAPLIIVTVSEPPTRENFQQYLDDMYAAFQAQPKFALILNSAEQPTLPQQFRDMQSQWLEDTKDEFLGRWVSAAFIIPSRAIRGALKAIFWMQPPYFPYNVVSSMEEALSWTASQLAAAGVDAPSDRSGQT